MFDCLSEIKIIGFETYCYFSYQPQFSLPMQAVSETARLIVESMITVNGITIMIMCVIKLLSGFNGQPRPSPWNLCEGEYQKLIECCLISCNRNASLLQADILKFANSIKLPCKQFVFGQTICKQLFSNFFPPANNFLSFFGTSPANIKWFVPKDWAF